MPMPATATTTTTTTTAARLRRTDCATLFRHLRTVAFHSTSALNCFTPKSSILIQTCPRFLAAPNPLHPRHSHPPPTIMSALAQTQTRLHMGHSHGHGHHSHDTSLLLGNKKDAGVRITRIGLFSNLGMALAKGIGGYVFNSQSMIADAWHSLTDLASDILTLATVSWSLKPPTALFPTGFGKVESLGSLGVSGMLLFGGCFMCLNSCEILYAHFFLDAQAAAEAAIHAHGHSHSHAALGPSIHAAWLAAGTVMLKEWLYQASMLLLRPSMLI